MQRRQALQSLGALMLGGRTALGRPDQRPAPPTHPLLQPQRALRASGRAARRPVPVAGREVFSEMAGRAGLDVECTKDGAVFDGDLDQYAAVVSYTCGRPADLMKPGEQGRQPAPLRARLEEPRCGRARRKALRGRPSRGLAAARGRRGRLPGPRQPAGCADQGGLAAVSRR